MRVPVTATPAVEPHGREQELVSSERGLVRGLRVPSCSAGTVEAVHVHWLALRQHQQLKQLGGTLVSERNLLTEGCYALEMVADAVILAPAHQVRRRRLGEQRDHRAEVEP